jgi:hypothetical protein
VIFEPRKKIYFSTYPAPTLIHSSHSSTSALNPKHTCILLLPQPLPHLHFNLFVINETFAKFLNSHVNRFTRQTLPIVNRKHFFMNIICIEPSRPHKNANRTLFFVSTLLKDRCHFGYWNQPLNMRMRVCYLDCHETRLCCYLVIHIGNLLRPLQLFYFHLWLCLVLKMTSHGDPESGKTFEETSERTADDRVSKWSIP